MAQNKSGKQTMIASGAVTLVFNPDLVLNTDGKVETKKKDLYATHRSVPLSNGT